DGDGAAEVDVDEAVEVRRRKLVDGPAVRDAGVVDHGMHATEGVECGLHDGRALDADVVGIGDGGPTRRFDLGHHRLGGVARSPGAVAVAAVVVDDHPGALTCEEQRVGTAQASARARDDDDVAVEMSHVVIPPGYRLSMESYQRAVTMPPSAMIACP